ncbi:MAG: sulfatase-like hydrolase/transferase [Clostridia bacterium]|nr:sulfatase-like hydrolase/transferase [Clostridia bacterium]
MKNILLIITDQQRKDALGCYNEDIYFTPNIDKLAKNGVCFDNCFVANPVCTPNRVSIFTGRYVKNHGVHSNGLVTRKASPNLIEYLLKEGFQTASFGKIHFEPFNCDVRNGSRESIDFWSDGNADIDLPYHGFEEVELTIGHTLPLAHYGKWFYENGGSDDMLWFNEEEKPYRYMPANLHDSSFVADKTVDFLKHGRDEKRPFFAVASFPDPHFPFNPPKEYYDKFKDMNIKFPVGESKDLEKRPAHYMVHNKREYHSKETYGAAYKGGKEVTRQRIIATHAMNNLIDDCVGRIMTALEEENLKDDTLVIYTADHGELLGDYGLWYKGPFFFDSLLNVPLIMSHPDLKKKGHITGITSSIDILPTALDLVGIGIPALADGFSHSRYLREKAGWDRRYALTEYRARGPINIVCYTDSDFKFVYYENGDRELYDKTNDPLDKREISYDRPDITALYEKKLLQAMVETKSDYPEYTGKA